MGNSRSILPAETPSTSFSATVSTSSVQESDGQSPPKIGHEGTPNRDENYNNPKLTRSSLGLSQLLTSDHDVAGRNNGQSQQAVDGLQKDDTSSPSASNDSMSQGQRPSIMTPVTLPVHPSESSDVPSTVTTGVTYAPYIGTTYQTPLAMPPFQNYLPVGPPLTRYPAVESYSAMLANIGTQFQLAQEQSQSMHQSYIPSGYITLAGPHVSVPPVLIPAAPQEVPRERSIPTVTKTSGHIAPGGQPGHMTVALPGHRQPQYRTHDLVHSKVEHPQHLVGNRLPIMHGVYQDNHTVKVERTYMPTVPSSTETSLPRTSSDLSRTSGPSRESSQRPIPSLDAVLGKTMYPQHASGPGGIKIELPPPTIGIHIGTRPSILAHHNMAIVPPLKPKSNVYAESSDSFKVVTSSLNAPMTCIGETFASSSTAPYSKHKHKSSMRHSAAATTRSHSAETSTSLSTSVSHVGPFVESNIQTMFHFADSKSSDGHVDRYGDKSNSSTGTKQWPANHLSKNIQETFQVKDRQLTGGKKHMAAGSQRELASRPSQSPVPKDKQNVQSSRPILTAQAPPPMANVPSYFTRGSIIQLASGQLKRVEELQTEDFISSAQLTDGLKVDSSTVSRIEEDGERNVANISFLVGEHNAQVTVEARLDHPFFVYGQGWSSVNPEVSQKCYALNCHTLAVGDVCISLTVMEKVPSPNSRRPPPSSDTNTISSHQLSMSSPERKRQRFQETRTTHFEESLEDNRSVPTTVSKPSAIKSLSLDRQRILPPLSETTSQSEGIVTDQNRNIISSRASCGQTKVAPITKEVSCERWNQPPKRRWSDPIKCSQTITSQMKEAIPNAPHPTSLARLAEEN